MTTQLVLYSQRGWVTTMNISIVIGSIKIPLNITRSEMHNEKCIYLEFDGVVRNKVTPPSSVLTFRSIFPLLVKSNSKIYSDKVPTKTVFSRWLKRAWQFTNSSFSIVQSEIPPRWEHVNLSRDKENIRVPVEITSRTALLRAWIWKLVYFCNCPE